MGLLVEGESPAANPLYPLCRLMAVNAYLRVETMPWYGSRQPFRMYSMPAKARRTHEILKTARWDANILYPGIATFYQRLEIGGKFY